MLQEVEVLLILFRMGKWLRKSHSRMTGEVHPTRIFSKVRIKWYFCSHATIQGYCSLWNYMKLMKGMLFKMSASGAPGLTLVGQLIRRSPFLVDPSAAS